MTRFERRWLSLLVVAASCVACAPNGRLPMVRRPNTARIVGLTLDSSVVRRTVEYFRAALPKEAAVCYAGIMHGDTLVLTDVWLSRPDSADQFHVYFPASPRTGCTGPVVGAAHSHPYTAPENPCANSDPDALVLFTDPRLVVSLVFCGDGRGESLLGDGRRSGFRWSGS